MNLHDAYEAFVLCNKSRGLSPATHRWYEQKLSRLIRFLNEREIFDIEQVTTTHLRLFSVSLREQKIRWADHPYHPACNSGLSPYTVHTYIRAMRTFFRWLTEEGIIGVNPARRVALPDLPKDAPKDISPENRDRLLKAAKPDPRDYAIVCFLADTGCRVGGLVGLTLEDLFLDDGEAVVREKGRGGHKTRVVFFTARTKRALRRWLEARPDGPSTAVFLSKKTDEALTTNGINQLLKRLAEQSNVEGCFNPHSFRHGWAHEALRNGASLADVSQVLGHETKTVTIRFYTGWTTAELKERHNKFSPLGDFEANQQAKTDSTPNNASKSEQDKRSED